MELDYELRTAERCRKVLARQGIQNRACTMVLFGMVVEGLTFDQALLAFADYEELGGDKWPPERWRSEICYRMLKAWILEPPGQWFEMMAGEVMNYAD